MKAKILVVDDDPNLRKTLSDILRVKGYETVVAANGAEASAAAVREVFSLALIDLMLPDMPGLEVMARIKAISPLTEVIILTGYASMDTAIKAISQGAFSYLTKPYQMDDLLQKIGHAVERQQAHEEIIRLASFPRLHPSPVLEVNSAGRVTYANPVAEKLFPDLISMGWQHPLLNGLSEFNGLRQNKLQTDVIREVKVGIATYELHIFYVQEVDLTRIYILDITERKQAEDELRKLSQAVEQSPNTIIITDLDANIEYVNDAYIKETGYSREEVIGQNPRILRSGKTSREIYDDMWAHLKRGEVWKGELINRRKDGSEYIESGFVSLIRDADGRVTHYLGIKHDITEHKRIEAQLVAQYQQVAAINAQLLKTNQQLEQTQNQLLQSEKMAAIGLLAAGVAHEINNPVGYVNSNLGTLEKYLADIFVVMDKFEAVEVQLGADNPLLEELRQFKAKIDLGYIREDTKSLIAESHQGLERVKKIILDLKEFSHADSEDHWVWADVHQGLDSTLNVVWNELKYKCEVVKEYGTLPDIYCLPSQLNQVFMDLLVNAEQAIEVHGKITIRTGQEGDRIWVEVTDTGKGIPPEDMPRLFDPFFTTKPVGIGTGLGLSVSYNIVEKHHGKFEVQSEVGKGSTFRVWLPVQQPIPKEKI